MNGKASKLNLIIFELSGKNHEWDETQVEPIMVYLQVKNYNSMQISKYI